MATGCNFICDNGECEHHGKSITLTGPWPMASVDKMIKACSSEPSVVAELKTLQDNERQYACLILPMKREFYKPNSYADLGYYDPDYENDYAEEILVLEAYRIQKWCQKCKLISVFEVDIEEAQKVSERNDTCGSCNETLMGYVDSMKKGIECPFCHDVMKQERWYVEDIEDIEDIEDKKKDSVV